MSNALEMPLIRYLAMSGIGSRRYCDKLIQDGRVSVNGITAGNAMRIVPDKDRILIDGASTLLAPEMLYILLNKPRGFIVSDNDPEGRPLARTLLPDIGMRLFPVGRLDFQTEGAILFTNDGIWANKIAHPRNKIPKTYHAKVRHIPRKDDLAHWTTGIKDQGQMLRAERVELDHVTKTNAWLIVTLTGGVNRQVRRMGDASGFPVVKLIRTAIGPIELGTLKCGEYRFLTPREVKSLMEYSTGNYETANSFRQKKQISRSAGRKSHPSSARSDRRRGKQ